MTSLYGNWPMVKVHGKWRLRCGKCAGSDITIKGEPRGRGTGPGGIHRMGDPSIDVAVCNGCGHKGYHMNSPYYGDYERSLACP